MSSTVSTRPALVGTLLWLGIAIALGASGVLTTLPPPAPQLLILVLTLLAIVVATRIADLRDSIAQISTRTLVAVHAVRFVGFAFLMLAAKGELSELFARRAGWGDVVVAASAVVLASLSAGESSLRRYALLAWNIFGMLDLVLAVSTAAFVVMRGDVPGMQAILRLPLALVPLFLVPLLFASHVVLLRRLAR